MIIPPQYILERWTKYAKGGVVLDECGIKSKENGSKSEEVYRIALHALQKANDEVVAAFNNLTVVDESISKDEKSEPNSLNRKSVIRFEPPNVSKKVEPASSLYPFLEEGEKVSLRSVNKGVDSNICN